MVILFLHLNAGHWTAIWCQFWRGTQWWGPGSQGCIHGAQRGKMTSPLTRGTVEVRCRCKCPGSLPSWCHLILRVRTSAPRTSSEDLECHLSGGKGARAGAWEWESSQIQSDRAWSPWDGFESPALWSCPSWELQVLAWYTDCQKAQCLETWTYFGDERGASLC